MKVPPRRNRLPRAFYDRDPATVARELLGKALLRRSDGQWLGGLIVETEAYLSSGDLASHSARGKKRSNAAMFGPPGTLYVYPIHAKYCMNAVTQAEGIGSAVLIRAIEPVWGTPQMQANRETDDLRRTTRGPAMLCQALRVDRDFDAVDLLASDEITIASVRSEPPRIVASKRIGISSSADLMLRFFADGNWFVSGRVSDHRSRPTKPIPEKT
jgi:DNA-3-methyladenine glycosylase